MFNKYKNRIEELERELSFWQKSCDESQEHINKLKEDNNNLKNENKKITEQLTEMYSIKKENEIMREYYKLNEEPSSEIQAKVLTNLRIHDLELQMIQEKINAIDKQRQYLALTATYSIPFIPMWR